MKPPNGLLASLLALSTPAAALADGVLPPETLVETLDNGMRLVVVPLDSELVNVQARISAGARDEVTKGTTGYAHFFEHLMFRGSARYTAEQREDALLRAGAVDNAWTSDDQTNYHITVRADRLPTILDLEADRFIRLTLTPDAVRQEAGAVMGELRKDRSDPGSVIYEALYATAFTTHPYHHTPIGLEEDVLGMADGFEIAQNFYATFYRPERLTLVIAGGVDPRAVRDMVAERFAAWSPPLKEAPPIPEEPAQTAPRRDTIDWAGDVSDQVAIGWKAPAFSPTSKESAALVLAQALLTARAAPLTQTLVQEKRLAQGVWGDRPTRIDPGLLALFITLREGADPAEVEALVEEAVVALRAVSPQALEAAKARTRRQLLLSLGDPAGWAGNMAWYATVGEGPASMEAYLETLASVTVDDLTAAVSTWLIPTQRTTIVLIGEGA
ncbi:MAG: pitrilysin family protein [Myxococcota bacterium]